MLKMTIFIFHFNPLIFCNMSFVIFGNKLVIYYLLLLLQSLKLSILIQNYLLVRDFMSLNFTLRHRVQVGGDVNFFNGVRNTIQ